MKMLIRTLTLPIYCWVFLLIPASFAANSCPAPTGEVTDPIGDSTFALPDLVSGSAAIVGSSLRLRARFVPGTFDPAKTLVVFTLDTDQNPATGSPGIDSNGNLDASSMGTDYIVSMGSSFYGNLAYVEKYVGPPPNTFSLVARVPVTFYPDGIDALVPAGDLGLNGPLNFVVETSSQVSANAFTPILDVMPNVGLPPGTTACIAQRPTTQILSGGIVNAASFMETALAPGEVVSLFGAALGPDEPAGIMLTSTGTVSTEVSGVQVLFDGVPGPLIYVQANEVSAVVPYSVAGNPSIRVQLSYNGQSSPVMPISVAPSTPAFFTADSSGFGPAAALNQDGSVNSVINPAPIGSAVVLFATGEGQTTPAGVDGKPASNPLPRPLLPVSVAVAGSNADILYYGGSPGLVAGVMQVNVQLPQSAPSVCVLPATITVGNATSPPVFIFVKCATK